VPPSSFLPALRSLADEAGALLVLDEIWTGIGRSGAMLASADAGVVGDVVCLGKALGGGLPISACVGRARVMEAWGSHGGSTIHTGTHFGSPPACAAALATLDAIGSGVANAAKENGERLLEALARACPSARVRGRGLMIGVELGSAAEALATARAMLARGYVVLTGGARSDTLTLTPPLTIAPELLDAAAAALGACLAEGARA
jgi:4-aminobutyrate aminotransferase/(S)-3-amino-2-methylpropionate transaminase